MRGDKGNLASRLRLTDQLVIFTVGNKQCFMDNCSNQYNSRCMLSNELQFFE